MSTDISVTVEMIVRDLPNDFIDKITHEMNSYGKLCRMAGVHVPGSVAEWAAFPLFADHVTEYLDDLPEAVFHDVARDDRALITAIVVRASTVTPK